MKGIKVSKKQFIEKSHLKPAQWKQLELKFSEFIRQVAGLDTITKENKQAVDSLECNSFTQTAGKM